MGIFDSAYFDPNNYNGLLGGLLSRLQMPVPQPGGFDLTNDLSAQSVQPQYSAPVQQQQQLPSALQPPPGGNFGAGVQGFLNAQSPMQAIGNLISGFATGQRTDPSGMAQQTAQSIYQALKASGAPEGAAQMGALSPEALKIIGPAYLDTAPKLQKTGTNPFTGQDTFAIYKPNAQTLTEAPVIGANGQSSANNTAVQQAMQNGVTGNDFLDIIKNDKNFGQGEVNIIKKMVSGDLPPPSSFALAKPVWQTRIAMASQYDPSFSASTWTSRFAMARDASTGTVAKTNNALNTGIGHIMQLADAVANLGNTDYQPVNWVKNIIGPLFGSTSQTNFEAIRNRVAPEITRIWRGAGGAEADIKRDIDNLSLAKTPDQLYGVIANIAGLMESKIQANQKQYSDAMGPNGRNPDFMIAPENRASMEKIRQLAGQPGSLPTVSSPAEAKKLPRGTRFRDPNGVERIVP